MVATKRKLKVKVRRESGPIIGTQVGFAVNVIKDLIAEHRTQSKKNTRTRKHRIKVHTRES